MIRKHVKKALCAILLVALLAAGVALVPGSKAASGQPAQVSASQVDANNLPSAKGKSNVPAPSFPAAAGVICPSSVSPMRTAPAVKQVGATSTSEVADQLASFETSVKGAKAATPDKRTSTLATCYYAPAIYLNPKSVTLNVGQTFTFTLEIFYAEYGCDLSWAGHIGTDASGHFGPQTYTPAAFNAAGTFYLTVSCGGLGGTGVDQIVVTVQSVSSGGGGNPPGNPCDQQSTSQMWATFMGGTINGTPMVQGSTLTVTAGASLQYQMSFRNDGACPWSAALAVRAGSTNPDNNLNLGTSRIYIPAGVTYTTGQTWPINAFFYAPTTAGCYTVGWRMLKEYVVWFGSQTNASLMTICVTGSVTPPPTTSTAPTTTTTPTTNTLACNPSSGPVLATGQLQSAGTPVAGVVKVFSTAGMEFLAVNGNKKQVQIGEACASSTGNFTLRADPTNPNVNTAIQDATANNGGWLNLDFEGYPSVYQNAAGSTSTERQYSGGVWLAPKTNIGATGTESGTAVAGPPQSVTINMTQNPVGATRLLQSVTSCIPDYTVVATYVAPVVFGNLHTSPDMTGNIKYATNGETSIETGLSIDGTSWKVDHNSSTRIGNSGSVSFPEPADSGHQYRIDVLFHKIKFVESCGYIHWTRYVIKAIRWTGGGSRGISTHNLDHQCMTNPTYRQYRTVMTPGSGASRGTFRSIKYTNGVSVGGVTLGSTTEDKKSVSQTWKAGTLNTVVHSRCGTNDFVLNASSVLAGD